MWTITDAGRRQLQDADVELPESPQHRRWRQAQALAAREVTRFRRALEEALRDGLALLESDAPAHSDVWHALEKRLERTCSRVTSTTYCAEWAEPDDSLPDTPESCALVICGLLRQRARDEVV